MNMRFYNRLRTVPNDAKKPIAAGRLKGFSDINPMWRIKALTETFGPCGLGWWYEITDKRMELDPSTNQIAAFMDILLFYKDPVSGEISHGIPGTGGSSFATKEKNGIYVSDECYKMALTDSISVAAKALGMAADVYYEKDRSKYTATEDEPKAPAPTQKDDIKFRCAECGSELAPIAKGDRIISVREWHEGTKKEFGRPVCLNCRRKLIAAQREADALANALQGAETGELS